MRKTQKPLILTKQVVAKIAELDARELRVIRGGTLNPDIIGTCLRACGGCGDTLF